MRLISWVLVALLGGVALYKSTACELGHGCTELGCGDGVSVSAAFADHRWPAGAYELEVVLDEAKHVCSFVWPENPPARGGVDDAGCELNGLFVHVAQDVKCTEQRTATAVTQSCQPLLGQYHLEISAVGAPKHMQLRVMLDGVPVTEQDLTLAYREDRPNGPDCEPLCRNSSQELQLD